MTKILVTGASGFIGSNLVPRLIKENHEVYCLLRYVSNRVPNLPPEANPVFCDLRDSLDLKKIVKDTNPEIIVHLASCSSVAYSHLHTQEVFDINLIGTINMALAAKELSGLEKFIFAGTSEEYGNQEVFPIKEDAPLKPNQPYAISKVAADGYLNYLYTAFGFPAIIARPFNTYGRTDNFNFVTERIITQMLGDRGVTLGNPNPIRDLLYIDDHVNGYVQLIKHPNILEKLGKERAINFCTGKGVTIKVLAEKIAEIIGYDSEKINWKYSYSRPTEIDVLEGDNKKAKTLLGWESKIGLDKGLELAVKRIMEKGP